MKRPLLWSLAAGMLVAGLRLAAQGDQDGPEAVIRALIGAMYSNDVASYERLTTEHPLRSRLTAGGSVNEDALRDLKEDPGGLQMRKQREFLFRGKLAAPGGDGHYPVGTTALYTVAHRRGPMVMLLVRRPDGWKADVRWWLAMSEMAAAQAPPPAGSPDFVIRSMLMAMLRLDRKRAATYLTDAKNIDALFVGAPPYREPSGVLEASVIEMPLVEIGPGEFCPMVVGPPVEGSTDPNRKVLMGLFGPSEIAFVVRKAGSDWRVVAHPYFAILNR